MLEAQNPLVTDLGGGCASAAATGAPGVHDNAIAIQFLSTSGGNPAVWGSFRIDGCNWWDPSEQHLDMLLVGFSDPSIPLTSCGCVLHTSAEFALFATFGPGGGSPVINYPGTLAGQFVYVQNVFLPVTNYTWPVPGFTFGPAWATGCTEEPNLAPLLSKALRVEME